MRKAVSLLLIGLALFMVTACNLESIEEKQKNDSNHRDDIVIGLQDDVDHLLANTDDSHVIDTQIRNIYEPLITYDPETEEYIGVLAKEWENIDEETWKIILREDITYHNGEPFDAEAVKFNIDYILNKENKSAFRSAWKKVDEVHVLSTTELEIKTSKPFVNMIERMAADLLMMEPTYVNEVGTEEAGSHPIGTGPYAFDEWESGQSLELEAYDNYWGDVPSITNVEFRYLDGKDARLSAFLSGDIDLLGQVPYDSIPQIENNEQFVMKEITPPTVNYIALNNVSDGPMKNKHVRQAINHIVDREELVKNTIGDYGSLINGPVVEGQTDYVEVDAYPHDEKKAHKLLKKADYSPKELSLVIETTSGHFPMDQQVAQEVASQLRDFGISVDVQVNNWDTHQQRIEHRDVGDMFLFGWGPSYDAQSVLKPLFTKDGQFSSFYQKKIEKELKQTSTTYDAKKRAEQYEAIQKKIVDQAAWLPLWQPKNMYAIKANLQFDPSYEGYLFISEMRWENTE